MKERIIELREKKGWSQEELASKMTVDLETIANWEKGESSPIVDQIVSLANIFGVSMDYLVKGEKKENSSKRRVYRTNENKMICGVCSGLGEYFDIDVTLIRLAFVVLSFFGGTGIIAYIVCAIIFPNKNEVIGK